MESGKKDIIIIAAIAIILVGAVVFFLLRILGHSEEHVDTVKKTKIQYKESLRWRPDSSISHAKVLRDYKRTKHKKEGNYGDLVLSKKSFKLISKMYWLDSLKLTRASFKESWLKYLTDLPITKLHLHGASVSDKSIKYILKFDKLDTIAIGDTDITDSGLQALSRSKKIKRLEVNLGRKITNAGVKYIGDMTQLVSLELSSSKYITSQCFVYLTGLDKLKGLDVESIKISPADWVNLQSLPKLRILDASDANLVDKDLEEIAKLKKVQLLNLSGSEFTNKGLMELSKLKHLRGITIKDCPYVSPEGVAEFKKASPNCNVVYSPTMSIDEKLKREDVRGELRFLEHEAQSELKRMKKIEK